VDGLSTRQIGRMEGKNQSNVSRAVSSARARLREKTLEALGKRLSLTDSQLESVVGLVLSRIELNLRSALGVER
jgi:RNA polymerase sigma-70 factor (ECF subfamily)